MRDFDKSELKKLYIPQKNSHKGQNGKLMIIGGSKLFHGASLWALKVSSRIVDMVFYSSVSENNRIVEKLKEEFKDGIVVPREKNDHYIEEADCVLIGPGLPRKEGQEKGDDDTKELTERLLKRYPEKKWVIDGGSLQVLNPEILMLLREPVLTPHAKEFEMLFGKELRIMNQESGKGKNHNSLFMIHDSMVGEMARKYNCTILLKGSTDIVCPPRPTSGRVEAGSPNECERISGGNAGMTKGGTGDVLAGLVASLYCKNDAFLSAASASFINKKAGENLFKKVGYYFNASDLANEIPKVMKEIILTK